MKLIFPTDYGGNAALAWSMCYIPDTYITGPDIQTNESVIQAVQGSQTGPVPTNRVISRYFSMAKEKKRLGISDCEINQFNYFG